MQGASHFDDKQSQFFEQRTHRGLGKQRDENKNDVNVGLKRGVDNGKSCPGLGAALLTNRSTQKKEKSDEMNILAANAPAILRKKDSTKNLNRKIFEVLQRKQQPLVRTSSRDRTF